MFVSRDHYPAEEDVIETAEETHAHWLLDNRRRVGVLLSLIVVAGLAIRGYQISLRPIWFDEAFSWRLSQFPLSELLSRAARDNNPPLYYLLLKAWIAVFGESLFAMRWLSVLLGGTTIVAMYLFMFEAMLHTGSIRANEQQRTRRARGAALFAAALVAVSAFHIFWAWEVRMYTLGTTLAALSSWAMFRALRREKSRWQPWAWYALLTVLFTYTHTYALFSIAAQALFLFGFLLRSSRGVPAVFGSARFRHALLAVAIFAVGVIPWAPVLLNQRAQVQHDFWTQPISGWDVPHVCYEMFVEPVHAPLNESNAAIAATLCGLGFAALFWRARAGEWYIAAAALVPFALSVLVSQFDTRIFGLRYFLFANLFFWGALAVLVWRIPRGIERGVIAVVILVNLVGVDVVFWNGLRISELPGVRAALASIENQRKAGEPIVVCHSLLYFSVKYHAVDRQGCRMYNDGRDVVHYHGRAIVTPEDLVTADQLQAMHAETVWVLNMDGGWWGTRVVPVPGYWNVKSEQRFEELFGPKEITVVAYSTAR